MKNCWLMIITKKNENLDGIADEMKFHWHLNWKFHWNVRIYFETFGKTYRICRNFSTKSLT